MPALKIICDCAGAVGPGLSLFGPHRRVPAACADMYHLPAAHPAGRIVDSRRGDLPLKLPLHRSADPLVQLSAALGDQLTSFRLLSLYVQKNL